MKKVHVSRQARLVMQQVAKGTEPDQIALTDGGEAYMKHNPKLRNPLPDDIRAGLIQLAVSVVSVALGFVLGRI